MCTKSDLLPEVTLVFCISSTVCIFLTIAGSSTKGVAGFASLILAIGVFGYLVFTLIGVRGVTILGILIGVIGALRPYRLSPTMDFAF